MATVGHGPPSPQEASLDLRQLFERLLRGSEREQLVHWYCVEDRFDKGKTPGFVHEPRLPGRKPGSHRINEGLQLGGGRPSRRQRDAQISDGELHHRATQLGDHLLSLHVTVQDGGRALRIVNQQPARFAEQGQDTLDGSSVLGVA